jgi:phosphatidyl-myo-inositol dimannoside synthase
MARPASVVTRCTAFVASCLTADSMRILFVSSDFLPTIGGISLMVHGLAEACADLRHDVCLLAPGPETETDSSLPYRVIRDTRRQPHLRQRIAWLLHDHHTASRVRELVEDIEPDAILLGVYKDYASACLMAGERFHIPVGGLVHGFDVVSVLDRRPSGLLALLGKTLGPSPRRRVLQYLQHADRIFVNSSVTSAHVERRCGRRPITIGCGVPGAVLSTTASMEQATVERPAIRARLGLREAPTIGFLGRLIARKNVESILESLAALPACSALIVGDGPMRDSLQILAKELGVSERTTFAGQVDEQSKWDYLRAMDVFCMASKEVGGYNFEGFGIAFLEATVAGVPVVGGRSGGIPDVVIHEQTGLLADPNDWRDVARCLRRMLEDHELAAHCVYAAQTQLRDRFNWPVIARRVINELRDASIETPQLPFAGRLRA